jgi:hypothetical protein
MEIKLTDVELARQKTQLVCVKVVSISQIIKAMISKNILLMGKDPVIVETQNSGIPRVSVRSMEVQSLGLNLKFQEGRFYALVVMVR